MRLQHDARPAGQLLDDNLAGPDVVEFKFALVSGLAEAAVVELQSATQ